MIRSDEDQSHDMMPHILSACPFQDMSEVMKFCRLFVEARLVAQTGISRSCSSTMSQVSGQEYFQKLSTESLGT